MRGDIGDRATIDALLAAHRPRAIVNFAAESHVDRSIHGPAAFIETNIVGTFALLEAARAYWSALPEPERSQLSLSARLDRRGLRLARARADGFTETTPYAPNSPYSASKAASDHLVRAYHHTYGLPTLTTNCSNNYGPLQFPEKLIPLMILNALAGKPLPVYGDGQNVRDWLYVDDHCAAIRTVLARGAPGETYNIGGNAEKTNIEVVHTLCRDARRAAAGPRLRARRSASSTTGPATTAAMRSTRPRSAASSAGRRARRSNRDSRDRALVSRPCGVAAGGEQRRIPEVDLAQLHAASRHDGRARASSWPAARARGSIR